MAYDIGLFTFVVVEGVRCAETAGLSTKDENMML